MHSARTPFCCYSRQHLGGVALPPTHPPTHPPSHAQRAHLLLLLNSCQHLGSIALQLDRAAAAAALAILAPRVGRRRCELVWADQRAHGKVAGAQAHKGGVVAAGGGDCMGWVGGRAGGTEGGRDDVVWGEAGGTRAQSHACAHTRKKARKERSATLRALTRDAGLTQVVPGAHAARLDDGSHLGHAHALLPSLLEHLSRGGGGDGGGGEWVGRWVGGVGGARGGGAAERARVGRGGAQTLATRAQGVAREKQKRKKKVARAYLQHRCLD